MNDAQSTLSGPDDFGAMLLLFGYAVSGENEVGCLVAENEAWVRANFAYWDRDRRYLDSVERWHGDRKLSTPWWWALPGVSELMMRREMAA